MKIWQTSLALASVFVFTRQGSADSLVGRGSPNHEPNQQVMALAFNPSGNLLVAGGYRTVTIYNPSTGQQKLVLSGCAGIVTSVQFSPDGKRLAASGGLPGRSGEVRVWSTGSLSAQPRVLTGPVDVVQSIAFSPDGTRLAGASYDHSVTIWDVAHPDAKPKVLQDHTDSVYSVAYRSDGRELATAAGDRTVKVWSATTGRRLYTLSESTAEVYSAAFRPDSRQIAAGGADKQLRTWAVTADGGKLAKSVFAHNGAVLKVAWSRDGRSLFTAGEDNTVKQWDSATLQEKRVLPPLPDWPQSIALSPDGKWLAVGCHNGTVTVYDVDSGRVVRAIRRGASVAASGSAEMPRTSAIPGRRLGDNRQRRPANDGGVKLFAASLGDVSPRGAQRGRTVRLTLFGGKISDATAVYFDDSAITARIVGPADPNSGVLRVDADFGPSARLGLHQMFAQTPNGTTGAIAFAVGNWTEAGQEEPNNSAETAQKVAIPSTIVGALDSPGDIDCYKVAAKAGQELVFEAIAQSLRSRLQPILTLFDETGAVLVESRPRLGRPDALLGYRVAKDGAYVLQIRDYEGAGGGDVHYRLNLGEFPVVTDVFPLGVQRGHVSQIQIHGFNLGGVTTVSLRVPEEATIGTVVPVSLDTARGPLYQTRSVLVGGDPEVESKQSNYSLAGAQRVTVPCAVNGRLAERSERSGSRAARFYRFAARKGDRWSIDVWARRAGSSLDSEIEVVDSGGRSIERAVVRPVYQTEVTLNDRDSATNALRIFAWDGVGVGDYMMVGREVVKVLEMPRGPDSDIFFRTFRGQRVTYFGTTPEYHSVGQPVYKVEMHPAGAKFSPNGFPVTRLTYRNDDGGPIFGKDSHLDFVAPADGDYIVKVADARGQESSDFAYRLMIHPFRPDYRLTMSPAHLNMPRATGATITVECERLDGFDGPITLTLEGLPAGFSCTSAVIEPGETSATLLVSGTDTAATADAGAGCRLVGHAEIDGRDVARSIEAPSGHRLFTVMGPPDARVSADRNRVVVRPGETISLEVTLDRQNRFGGRVPIDVKNLPYGVQVENIGLNGILVTEAESSRAITIRCEPWVKPQTRPFYLVANIEGGVPVPASPLLLTVLSAEPRKGTAATAKGQRRQAASRRDRLGSRGLPAEIQLVEPDRGDRGS